MCIISSLILEKYDNPGIETKHEFMIATTHRSGSTYFCQRLWETGCLGLPLEYLNAAHAQEFRKRLNAQGPEDFWVRLKRLRSTDNGVFSIKILMPQVKLLEENFPKLIAGFPKKAVLLTREDTVEQAVSVYISNVTKKWFFDGEAMFDHPPYDREKIKYWERYCRYSEYFWREKFKEMGTEFIPLTYEQFLSDEQGTIERVSDFVGVELDASKRVIIPIIQKERDPIKADMVRRFKKDMLS